MAPNVGFVSVIKRKLASLLRLLTPRTDLLMNPYFVPQLALLLMEGVGRRALSHVTEKPDGTHALPYQSKQPVEGVRRLARADAAGRQSFHAARNFGRPGPLR